MSIDAGLGLAIPMDDQIQIFGFDPFKNTQNDRIPIIKIMINTT